MDPLQQSPSEPLLFGGKGKRSEGKAPCYPRYPASGRHQRRNEATTMVDVTKDNFAAELTRFEAAVAVCWCSSPSTSK